MKANVRAVPAGNGAFHGCPLRLTVGVIVKNGAQTLEKCLDSVKPLLGAVPSELIVTDTGSTDGSVEIAERYTDRVMRFQWNGDFSAARNTGLAAARGEWFLFLDADEWFEDVSELIAFFRGNECDRYGSGCYIQRNYADFSGRNYADFHAVRIFRRYPGMRFERPIHESVRWLRPIRFFSAYVHHYGYAFRSPEEKREKVSRNLGMLKKALDRTPDDIKLLYQLARQYFSLKQYDKIVACCRRGLEEEKRHPQREWRLSFYSVLVKAYYDSRRYREAIGAVRECVGADRGEELPYLDYYLYETFSHYALKEYAEAADAGERYGRAFERYRRDGFHSEYLLYGNDVGVQPLQHENAAAVAAWSLAALGKYENAARKLLRIDLSVADVAGRKISALCFVLAKKTGDFQSIPAYYGRILATGDPAKRRDFISTCESCLERQPQDREKIVRALAGAGFRDNYIIINRMRASAADRDAVGKLLRTLTPDAGGRDAPYSDAAYLAMKSGADVSGLFDVVDGESLPGLLMKAERDHPDAPEVFLRYAGSRTFSGLKGLFWRVCLEERILLGYRRFSPRELLSRFREYVGDLNEYGAKIYRDELFTEQGASLLPRKLRFGRHMRRAYESEDADGVGYVRELRAALRDCPSMAEPIGLLVKSFEDESKKRKEHSEEFAHLAATVKDRIEDLIRHGRLDEARRVTAGLASLIPEDDDVRRYRRLTHTETSPRGAAAEIPQ